MKKYSATVHVMKYINTELTKLNYWRKYFRVPYLLELCNAEGNEICVQYLKYLATIEDKL
jgi:hypothetical protein